MHILCQIQIQNGEKVKIQPIIVDMIFAFILIAQYAVLRTTANSNKKFVGAGAQISTHNPHVDGRQYSAARVKIRNGPDSLETGWRVSLPPLSKFKSSN